MRIIEQSYDCASSSPLAAGGNLITQATVRSIQVLTWPHAQQQLIVEPVVERASARFVEEVRPGCVLRYAKPTDVIIRQRFAAPLLAGWQTRLAINPEQDEYTEPVERQAQWWPLCRTTRIPTGAGFTSVTTTWRPTISGTPRIRIYWPGAPGANAYIQIHSYCTSAGVAYFMTQTQFQNIQREEKRCMMVAPAYAINVVAGMQYQVLFSQQSGGALDISADIGVEEGEAT